MSRKFGMKSFSEQISTKNFKSRKGKEYFDYDCWTEMRSLRFESRKNFELVSSFYFFILRKDSMEKKEGLENSEWKVFWNEFLQRISSQERERNISITIAELRCALFDSIRERILNLFHLFIFLFFDGEKGRKFRSKSFSERISIKNSTNLNREMRFLRFDSRKNFELVSSFYFFILRKDSMEKKEGLENSEWKVFRNEFLQRISSVFFFDKQFQNRVIEHFYEITESKSIILPLIRSNKSQPRLNLTPT